MKHYIVPSVLVEELSIIQIISSSPTNGSTPTITDEDAEEGEGLAKENFSWGTIW